MRLLFLVSLLLLFVLFECATVTGFSPPSWCSTNTRAFVGRPRRHQQISRSSSSSSTTILGSSYLDSLGSPGGEGDGDGDGDDRKGESENKAKAKPTDADADAIIMATGKRRKVLTWLPFRAAPSSTSSPATTLVLIPTSPAAAAAAVLPLQTRPRVLI